MRYIQFILFLLFFASLPAQNIDILISQAEKAQSNGEFDVALEGFREAARLAQENRDTVMELHALERIVRIGITKKDPMLSLDARVRKINLKEGTPGYDAFDKLFDYGDIPVYLAKLGKRNDACNILRLMRKAAKDAGPSYFLYGFYSMQEGLTFQNLEEWDKAVVSFDNSLKFFTKSTETQAKDFIVLVKSLLAGAFFQTGKYEESYNLYRECAELISAQKGNRNFDYIEALYRQANIEAVKGNVLEGARHYSELLDQALSLAAQDLQLLPANARGKYWHDVNDIMWNITPYALEAGMTQEEFTEKAYEALMFSKGLMLSVEKSSRKVIEEANQPELLEIYLEIANLRNTVEQLKKDKKGAEVNQVYSHLDYLERELNSKLRAERIFTPIRRPAVSEIASSLKKGDAVIDFYDFEKKGGEHFYVAFLMKHGMRYPKLIKVFEQAAIDSLLTASGGHFSNLLAEYNTEAIRDILWTPLETALKGIKRLFFVPSGILHQLPFESIQYKDNQLLSDKFEIIRLSSSAEIPGFDPMERASAISSARLYGGLTYDVNAESMLAEARAYKSDPLLAMRSAPIEFRGDSIFRRLRQSTIEVDMVNEILSSANVKVDTLKGARGTEESFYAISGSSPDLLLFSTHGFYYSPEKVPSWSSLNGYDNPMYLTGLVMSGGNMEWMKREIPEGVMGGLLTSADISSTDLKGTKLVVLSACETALGQNTNEGVFGLQRAFKKAGANSILMSLWPVHDYYTKEFMVAFFNAYAKNGWNKRQALKVAQKEIKKRESNPYYWAGFIIVD